MSLIDELLNKSIRIIPHEDFERIRQEIDILNSRNADLEKTISEGFTAGQHLDAVKSGAMAYELYESEMADNEKTKERLGEKIYRLEEQVRQLQAQLRDNERA